MTMSDVASWLFQWLSAVWNGIFKVEIFDGITGALIVGGVFAISVTIMFLRSLFHTTGVSDLKNAATYPSARKRGVKVD